MSPPARSHGPGEVGEPGKADHVDTGPGSGRHTDPRRVLLVFLDGVGIGPVDPDRNPFLRSELPFLRGILGAPPTLDDPELSGTLPGGSPEDDRVHTFPLDATLGVEGIPQSGTGQAALLTGQNAARIFGRHFGPWVPVSLRPLVTEESLLARARAAGIDAAFANAYPERLVRTAVRRRPAATNLAAFGAGVLDRHVEALREGRAVASEIVNRGWRVGLGYQDLPEVTPEDAGATLARIAERHPLTLFAHYSTDLAGHARSMERGVEALERVDRFLAGIARAHSAGTLVVVASDHGNVEDVTAGHTTNPALGLTWGAGAEEVAARARSLTDLAGLLLGPLVSR